MTLDTAIYFGLLAVHKSITCTGDLIHVRSYRIRFRDGD